MSTIAELLEFYRCGAARFSGDENASYERHLVLDHVIDKARVNDIFRYEALASAVRDLLAHRWVATRQAHNKTNPKRVYYLSMEYLIGRSLNNNIVNLLADPLVRQLVEKEKIDLPRVLDREPDAGLGNGGLGRLAACFIDSMTTIGLAGTGYGLRYEYGIFRQELRDGFQVEAPDNWLRRPDPWEVARPQDLVQVRLSAGFEVRNGEIDLISGQSSDLFGIPYDRPVVGYGGKCINTLRLWGAATPEYFNFGEFSSGDFFGSVSDKVLAETLTRVLYPDDSTTSGKSLRFLQEYFLVSCSLGDILARFRRNNDGDWKSLPDKVAIQLNDTHPSMAVAEMMVLLLDQIGLGWDESWDLTTRTLAYTNHTLLPEALEKWPITLFERLLPRHLDVIYEINRRFLTDVRAKFPGDEERITRMSLIEEGATRQVRMANLCIVGTHSTNGVAAIHSRLLRTTTVKDFAEMFPERFNNKTNGVTPRRWLLMCNPPLSKLIRDTIGDGWITDLDELQKLKPLAEDKGFRDQFRAAKRAAKARFCNRLKHAGQLLDPDSIFDCQIKRIHEYKRQLLNALHIVVLYNRLRNNPNLEAAPRTFLFAGKAAPAYRLAKLIIKLINNIASTIDADPAMAGRLKVVFLPNYSVTLAEWLIPAADVSEQISTAGYEASGTSNMKFMMNGALTVGTRDGATIEMAEEAGEENFFLFGLTAEQVAVSRGWYSSQWHYQNEPETKAALDLIFNDHFSPDERGIFAPIRETLLPKGDYYMHLADLSSYIKTHEAVGDLYRDQEGWARKAILNVGSSGKFSSDRTIREYAEKIWGAMPAPVE